MPENSYIQHWGILGMRWGVRRTQKQLARLNKKIGKLEEKNGIKKPDDDKKDLPEVHGGRVSKKTAYTNDEDLRKIVNRMQLEKQFNDLTPREISAGEKAITKILNTAKTVSTASTYASVIYKNINAIADQRAIAERRRTA